MLSYVGDNVEEGPKHSSSSSSSSGIRRRSSAGSSGKSNLPVDTDNGPGFRHLPLSESTMLVWVYRFDKDDPYRPVPNQAALQFAPAAAKQHSPTAARGALDVEAIGRRSGAVEGAAIGVQGGPRDTGILAWLWGTGGGSDGAPGGGGGGGRGGGVRQHFIGSASWQGKPSTGRAAGGGRGEEEEDDIQRAIKLSLAMASGTRAGGVEESKG